MRSGAASGHRGYFHETAFYDSDEGFLALVMPFLLEGLQAGEPVVAAFAPANQCLVRDALGSGSGVIFIDGQTQYMRPANAIHQYRQLFGDYMAAGAAQIRVAGDVPHPGVGVPWEWWARYEAAVNHAYDGFPLWGLCPYDTRTAPAAVIDQVRRTHSHIATPGGHLANGAFEQPEKFLATLTTPYRDPLEREPARVELVDPALSQVRAAITAIAPSTRLTPEDVDGLLIAATEAVGNAMRHGLPPVRVRLWHTAERITVTVTDQGAGITDPFTGLMPAASAPLGGLGLWLAHQLCGYVSFEHGPAGFTIRLVGGHPAV